MTVQWTFLDSMWSHIISSSEVIMGTLVDIDGNSYDTVVIGTQEWTVQNFKCTRLNDGTAIPEVTDNFAWDALVTPGRCWYLNDYYKGAGPVSD